MEIKILVNEDEFKKIIDKRFKNKKGNYIELFGMKVYFNDKKILKIFEEELSNLLVSCDLVGKEWNYKMEILTYKKIISLIFYQQNGKITLNIWLTLSYHLDWIEAIEYTDNTEVKKILDITKRPKEKYIRDYFNFIKKLIGVSQL